MGLKVTSTSQDIPADMGPGGSKLQMQRPTAQVVRTHGAERALHYMSGSQAGMDGAEQPLPWAACPGR